MAAKCGIRAIYLATDDDEMVADTALWPHFTWLFLPAGDDAGRAGVPSIKRCMRRT